MEVKFQRLIAGSTFSAALLLAASFVSTAAYAGPVAKTSCPANDPCTPGQVYEGDNDPFPDSLNGSPALYKCNYVSVSGGAVSCKGENGPDGDYKNAFSLTSNAAGNSGTWTFDPDAVTGIDPVLYPTKIAVKAGNMWYFFEVAVGTLTGAWNTNLLEFKGLSHISFYDSVCTEPECDPNADVPLPAAAWLLLSGLAGLGVVSRRRKTA